MRFLNSPPKIIRDIKEATAKRIIEATKQFPDLGPMVNSYSPREIPPDGMLASSEFNMELIALFEELRGLYSQITAVSLNSLQQKNVLNEAFRSTKAATLKLINDLRVYQFLKLYPQYSAVRFVDFHTARNETKVGPTAVVDTESRILKLAVTDKRLSQLVHPTRGEARVSIFHHGGGKSGSLIQDFNPERMLDSDDSTFWADLIVTKEPIVQMYAKSNGVVRDAHGLTTDIEVTLNETTTVNSLRLLPFAEYPLILIDMAYKESVSQDHWVQVPGFKEKSAGLDWIDLQFRPIRAAQIRMTLLQENHIRGIYHLPERMVHATNLLEHAIPDAYLSRVGVTGLSDAQIAKVSIAPEMLGYLESLRDLDKAIESAQLPREEIREYELATNMLKKVGRILSKPDLSKTVDLLEPAGYYPPEEAEELIEVKTIEYMVGIRTLEVSTIHYTPVAYYASPEFHPVTTPISISLITDEVHPEFVEDGTAFRLTSIDYFVDLGEGLSYPILPANSTSGGYPTVKDEFVPIDRHTRVGYTRFKPIPYSPVTVRKNGVVMAPESFDFSHTPVAGGPDTGSLTILLDEDFSPTAIYTVTYLPVGSATEIDIRNLITSTALRIPEIFDGTDEFSHVRTKYVPHIAYEIINNSVSWSRRTGEGIWDYLPATTVTVDGVTYSSTNDTYEPIVVRVNNIKARNITDYLSGDQPAFTSAVDGDNVHEYFQVGSDFYFNEQIESKQITIQYNWMVQYVQLLATLRCFKQAGVDITPRVNDFHIRMETSPL